MDEIEFSQIIHSTKKIVLSAVQKHLAAQFYYAIDDVVQETYLRAYKGLSRNSFRGESLVSSWLYTIAKNEAIRMTGQLYKEEEKRKRLLKENSLTQRTDREEKNFFSLVEVNKLIERLPQKYREVFNLIAKGLSEKEIASELKISQGTVKSRKSRGRELLQKMLHKLNPEEGEWT